MHIFYWYSILLINLAIGSCKFLQSDKREEHTQAFRSHEGVDHVHEDLDHLLHPAHFDPANDGLWMLKTKIEQLKVFQAALKAKLEADRLMRDHKLHDDLERLLHPKKHPAQPAMLADEHSYAHAPEEQPSHYPAGGYQHEPPHPYGPPPPPPPYDPYYGH